jgi:Lar family restriction alleviation protein
VPRMNEYTCKACGALSYSSAEIEFLKEPKCSACGGEIAPAGEKLMLVPCPHCGAEKSLFVGTDEQIDEDLSAFTGYYAVCCSKLKGGCGSTSGYYPTEQEAVDNWNRRTLDIVLCRDCVNAQYEWSESNKNDRTCHCKKWHDGRLQTDFCSYGKRKEATPHA